MKDSFPLPNIPGYVDIKEAARILDVAESSVYRYVQSGRLPAYQAGHNIMVEENALKQFKPGLTGRPRKNTLLWRIVSGESTQFVTIIFVQVRDGQEEALRKRLEQIRNSGEHLFPGTVTRLIIGSKTFPGQAVILLAWRGPAGKKEGEKERELEAFKQELADVLDWETAEYDEGTVLMHT